MSVNTEFVGVFVRKEQSEEITTEFTSKTIARLILSKRFNVCFLSPELLTESIESWILLQALFAPLVDKVNYILNLLRLLIRTNRVASTAIATMRTS
jgi:hypothetical protein